MNKIIYTKQADYLASLRNEKSELLIEMETFAKEKGIPILNYLAADFLESLIYSHKPQRVLEIGTAIGYSTIRIARSLSKRGKIHTIEKSTNNVQIANEYFSQSGLSTKIKLHIGEASTIMPQFKKSFDFIFLDPDKGNYLELLEYSVKLLNKRGILFVDNLLWHGFAAVNRIPNAYKKSTEQIREFNLAFMNHKKLKSLILPVGDGIGLGIKL